jgi:hypothetical protein
VRRWRRRLSLRARPPDRVDAIRRPGVRPAPACWRRHRHGRTAGDQR